MPIDTGTIIPDFSVNIINPATGTIDPIWFQFLLKIFERTQLQMTAVTSVSGTSPIVSSGGTDPVISITPATSAFPGSMSAADKTKLDAISSVVASVLGSAPIVSSGGLTPTISITAATSGAAGSLSAADKTKLDGMTAGAAVSAVSGTAPIVSSGGTAPAISITAATPSAAGSMSAADKTKLDGISSGALSNFSAFASATQAIAAATQTLVIFGTKVFDDTTEYSTATSKFVAASAGTYVFFAGIIGTQTTSTRRQISIYVNGAVNCVLQDNQALPGTNVIAGASGPIKLAAGDQVNVEYFSALADTVAISAAGSYFRGFRLK